MIHHQMHKPNRQTANDYTPLVSEAGTEVVIDIEARPGMWDIGGGHAPIDAWTYNGSVPGPVIEARVGDTLVVRLTNRLNEPTTIHWHGLRLPPAMDGTQDTQKSVAPGETFEYRFALPDAGTFWYHPHANETVQLERGLYGLLIVRGPDERSECKPDAKRKRDSAQPQERAQPSREDPSVDREQFLVFDDLRLNWRGRVARPGGWLERHNGREGRVPLLNGRVRPTLEMAAGHVERWRLVNVASARYIRLSIGGKPFRIIGADGGLIEHPVETTEVLLAPAERIDLLVGPFAEGERLDIQSLAFDRGLSARGTAEVFGALQVGRRQLSTARIPDRLRIIEPIAATGAPPTRELRLGGRMSLRRGMDFLVNDEPHHHGEPVKVGDLQVWDLVNETPLDHPFHLHGFFFQVLDVNGAPPPYRSWKDTVNVPRKGRVKIGWLPDDRPGPWMAHCHILEHHAAGMMMQFEVARQ